MASHEGSRKRLKISRTESRPASSNMASSTSPALLPNGKTAGGSTSSHEQTLTALQTDIDAMRQIVTCKVCHRLLYEPYSLACGHTYCYSCLSQWLVDSRKKTCPDCRAAVNQQPTPSYLIRELVLVFVSRNELLPDGETSEEHNNYVKEEAEVVAKDKANTDPRTGGLFKGLFKRGLRGYIGPIHDAGDGVDRCPACHWELEEGYCNQCQEMIDPHEHLGFSDYDSDSDITDDELDHELDAEDAAAVFGADGQDDYAEYEDFPVVWPRSPSHRPQLPQQSRHARSRIPLINIRSSDEEDESDADDEGGAEGNLPDFVVDDDNVEYLSSEEADGAETSPARRRRGRTVVISDDEEDQDTTASAAPTSEFDDDSEDEGPVALGSQRRKRGPPAGRLQRGRRAISSDDESSTNGDDRESVVANLPSFSRLEDMTPGDVSSIGSGYDSDGVSTVHPMDDEVGYDGHMYHDDDDENESEESDDEPGWDTHHETPANSRQPAFASSHRLHNLGTRSTRHADAVNASSVADSSRSTNDHYRFPIPRPYYGTVSRISQPYGMFQSQPVNATLPSHPFHLGNTLSSVNSRAVPLSRNYNQRNNHIRSNPVHRAVSATSSRSSTAGGVDLRESNSSGSSSTLRAAATSGRRKRLLSISSDDSVEETRRSYEY